MRPGVGSHTSTATGSAAASLWRWNSPLPYLFGGLAATLGLLTVALVVLACSRRKPSGGGSSWPSHHNTTAAPGGQKPSLPSPLDMEPRIVVIMAGEAAPRFLAKTLPPAQPGQL